MTRCTFLSVGLVALFATSGFADDKRTSLFTAKPIAVKDNADPLDQLLVERYNAALTEAKAWNELIALGARPNHFDYRQLCELLTRLRKAGAELPVTPQERLEISKSHVEFAKYIEASAKVNNEAGVAKSTDVLLATYHRADAEIELLRVKRALGEK